MLELPIIVSPAALGAIILIVFNNPLGEWIQENVVYFGFTFAGIEGTVALILILVVIGLTALFAARRILGRAAHA